MTLNDLADYRGEWVEPARSRYHGNEIIELPPPSQAWAANEILNILQACVPRWVPGATLASLGPADPQCRHLLVEAKKLAFIDLFGYNADPRLPGCRSTDCCPRTYAESLCGRVDPRAVPLCPPGPPTFGCPATRSSCRPPTARATWCLG